MEKSCFKLLVWPVLFLLLWCAPALASTTQYTYDNLGRLIQVVYDNGATIVYAYDPAGNRTVQQVTAGQP